MTECSICLEEFKTPVKLKCEHYFCLNCIMKCENSCPLCRENIINEYELNKCCNCKTNINTFFNCSQYTKKGFCRFCKKKSLNSIKKIYFRNKIINDNKINNKIIHNTFL